MKAASAFVLCACAFLTLSAPMAVDDVPANVFLNDPADESFATVSLERLNGDRTRLDGRYVRVWSARLNPDDMPTSGRDGSADFRFEPRTDELQDCTWHLEDCSPFDAVNVYYHIDRFASEFWTDRLGVDISFQAAAKVHLPGDGAYAGSTPNTITFGLGSTMMKNSALDEDIIYHEYTHLVTTALGFEVDIHSPVETRALNEGYAHYFAASYSGDPDIGEWVATCPPREHCSGPPNDGEIATLQTDATLWNWNAGRPAHGLTYGACTRFYALDGKCKTGYHNFTDQYTWGIIWGSALWDLREAIGPRAADRLVLGALLRSAHPELSFREALDGILRQNTEMNGGADERTIANLFADRGIYPSTSSAVEVAGAGNGASLRLGGPNPFSDRTTLHVQLPSAGHATLAVFDMLGRRVAILNDAILSKGDYEIVLDGTSLPAGSYLGVLTAGSVRKTVTLTVVR